MALNLQDKKAIVAEVNEAAKGALSAVVADSRGVTVDAITALRKEAREAGVWMKVVRNTLAKRAVEGTDYECLNESLVGPSLIAFSSEHPGAAARIFADFAKKNELFELKAAAFEGNVVDVDMLAKLPTYDEAVARLMSAMKEASAGKLVKTIEAVRVQKAEEAA
ncbi:MULTISPECIES: 50S ribosomal protein L10 [Pseudoalteromonas]|uniref:Large ribosomal subunit protein uL10 n=9 Tax=Pseudoalteromonas TaxID=53246 RepID=A0A161ZVQ9_9GAMM|nr:MULTISPECIES: 50S ribosomal protein L10 [Pseudoalteromonas]AOT09887.1 50S ribosomal protein L10 [Pseudoalteromonas luteoviolacea]AOT14798.1 50S ribosomal protein L10 [Pseudoalteromonas luteoviolacea]AOT19714.1 50S ribosomal protein L10 [Pseudoalteromonas luteoviolacea]ESP91923.1 ribosomal protein L10 [Pseudoalteromonas luteoviolacea 2ta16]KID54555.1 50S ribosomal protein L10 [Pseudoalteromonas luteoviolacea]